MKLRHVILMTVALGATGALLLAGDLYRRLKDAEAAADISNLQPRSDSILIFGPPHAMGLLSLAFMFMAVLLLLLSALKDRKFNAALEGAPVSDKPIAVTTVTAIPEARTFTLNEMALGAEDTPEPAVQSALSAEATAAPGSIISDDPARDLQDIPDKPA